MDVEVKERQPHRADGVGDRVRRQPSRAALRFRLHILLLLLDVGCIYGAFFAARLAYPVAGPEHWLVIGSSIALIYVAAAFGARAYSTEVIVRPVRGVARSMQALIIAAGTVLFFAFSLKSSDDFSRMIFGLGLAGSVMALIAVRTAFLRRALTILGGNPYSVVLISDRPLPLAGDFSVILSGSHFDPDEDCPIMYDRLAAALRTADRVVVDCLPERRRAWAHALKGANVQAEIVASELTSVAPMALGHFGHVPTMVVARGPLSLPDRIIKRAFDITFAGAALVVLAPILLVTALAIKLESRGPIVFVQTRIGRGNSMFRMLKFRSMRTERSDGHGLASTARDDDRLTRVGRFIRKTSIDELPQLINVLIGDMSIVGPRPHALGSKAQDQLFWEIDQRYWHRHAAKPGLTGLAQVRGYRGSTDHRDDVTNRLEADLEYLHRWSIWRDLHIIAMTFRVVVHPNAY